VALTPCAAESSSANAVSRAPSRATSTGSYPSVANARANAAPMPAVAPAVAVALVVWLFPATAAVLAGAHTASRSESGRVVLVNIMVLFTAVGLCQLILDLVLPAPADVVIRVDMFLNLAKTGLAVTIGLLAVRRRR